MRSFTVLALKILFLSEKIRFTLNKKKLPKTLLKRSVGNAHTDKEYAFQSGVNNGILIKS